MKKLIILFLLLITVSFSQTSKWTQTFTNASGTPITSGLLEVVPYANTYPTGALSMTHLGDGVWTVTAPDGEYKLYYDSTAVSKYPRFWIGENRLSAFIDSLQDAGWTANQITTFLSAIKVSGENKIDGAEIDTNSIPLVNLADGDYGDLSKSGATWSIEDGKVTNSDLAGSISLDKLAEKVASGKDLALAGYYKDVPPFLNSNNVIQWFDCTNYSGNYIVDKINGYNIEILNKHAVEDWSGGIPFNTWATLKQDSTITALVSADVNNFWFSPSGSANEIPIVALLNNVDYKNNIYVRYNSDDSKILDIVFYSTALDSAENSAASLFFGSNVIAPTDSVVYVDTSGNDTSGDGTIDNPYLTVRKGAASVDTNGTVIIKSGTYKEDWLATFGSFGFLINKSMTIQGAGNVVFQSLSASGYPLQIGGSVNAYVNNITFDNESVARFTVFINGSGSTINKCRLINTSASTVSIRFDQNETNNILNYVSVKETKTSNNAISDISDYSTIKNCFLNFTGDIPIFYNYWAASDADSLRFMNNTIIHTGISSSSITLKTSRITGLYRITGNKIYMYGTLSRMMQLLYSASVILSNNTVTIDGDATLANELISSLNTAGQSWDYTVEDNTITNNNRAFASSMFLLQNPTSFLIKGNVINDYSPLSASQIKVSTNNLAVTGTREVSENTIYARNYDGYNLSIGSDGYSAAQANKFDSTIIRSNKILSYYHYDPNSNEDAGVHNIFFGGSDDPIIEYNYIEGGALGIVVKGGSDGVTTDKGMNWGSYNSISNNVIIDCTRYGILIKGVWGADIYHNTIYNRHNGSTFSKMVSITDNGQTNSDSTTTVMNNAIYSLVSSTITEPLSLVSWTTDYDTTKISLDYNCYYLDNGGGYTAYYAVGGSNYTSFASLQAAGWEANGINSNPKIISYANRQFWLSYISDCKAAGSSSTDITNVIDKTNVFGATAITTSSNNDMGAYIIE